MLSLFGAPQHQIGSRVVPPLFDVVLIASTGEVWTLAGYGHVTSGALQQEYFLGQRWLAEAMMTKVGSAEQEARAVVKSVYAPEEKDNPRVTIMID